MAPLQLRHFCVNRLSKRTLFYQVVGRWLCDTAYSLLFPKTVVRGISVKCICVWDKVPQFKFLRTVCPLATDLPS
jgi:hypothetical protein